MMQKQDNTLSKRFIPNKFQPGKFFFSALQILIILPALSIVFSGCKNEESSFSLKKTSAGEVSGDRSEEPDSVKGFKKDAEGDFHPVVVPPPITLERLDAFLDCEHEVLKLSVTGFSRVAETYMGTEHAERMKRLAESKSMGEAFGKLATASEKQLEKERREVEKKVEETRIEQEAEINAIINECGFDNYTQWEAFRDRLQPARIWRINTQMQTESMKARDETKANLDMAVSKGNMTEEQRDMTLAMFPQMDPPKVPELAPPLSDDEIKVLKDYDVQKLIRSRRP